MKKVFKKIIISVITWQARAILKRYKPKIIAITGSVGKTSTKDAIFTVLSKFKTVRKSEKSFNSEIGLPLTIIGVPNGWDNAFMWIENIFKGFVMILSKQPYPEYLVLEVGVGKPGDIKHRVAPWLKPDMVVITRFPDKPVHIEFFGTAEKIIEEKSTLAYALKKNGLLILNHDDEKVYALHTKSQSRTVSYGFSENATYKATYPGYIDSKDSDIPSGINFKLEYNGNTFPVMLPHVVGMHYVNTALSALACASEAGCDLLESINALKDFRLPAGRLTLIEGMKGSMLIDDTYNSSPVAMEAAIHLLRDIKAKRKVAVIGDMLELGKFTDSEHKEVGKHLSVVADIIVSVGHRAKFVLVGAEDEGFTKKNMYSFDNSFSAGEFLQGLIKKGDLVLLKGSQGIRMERALELVMAHPEQKQNLLCRQEREWIAKR